MIQAKIRTVKQPYIGITGIVTMEDVAILRLLAPLIPSSHRLMAGVLVSHKTMRGQEVPSKRYPKFSEVPALTQALVEFCWPVIHYNTGIQSTFEISDLFRQCPAAEGIQLNVINPQVQWVRWIKANHSTKEIILQINHSSASKMAGVTEAERIGNYVQKYRDCVDHALIDASGGTGKPVRTSLVREFLNTWNQFLEWDITLGVAGGLGDDSKQNIANIMLDVPVGLEISFDAETRVRVPHPLAIPGEKHQDQLNYEKALGYVKAVAASL